MIYIHTYEYILLGQKDHIQFYEYPLGHLFVCQSHDIPHLALVNTKRHKLQEAMENAVFQAICEDFGSYPSRVSRHTTLSFESDSFDLQV